MKGLKHPATAVVVICAALIAGGASYAAAGGLAAHAASSRLYACVQRVGEANELSLSTATGICPHGGHKIFWNIQGKPGPRGKTGGPGPAGSTGATGSQGPPGPSTGPAGGDLTGSYPNPLIVAGAVTNAKLANPALTINPGTGLTGGGSVALGGQGTLGVADGGIGTTQLQDGAVTTSKFDPSAEAPNAAKLGGIAASGFIQGTGQIESNHIEVARPAPTQLTNDQLLTIGNMTAAASCDGNTGDVQFQFLNTNSLFPTTVWLDDEATGLTVVNLVTGHFTTLEGADRVIAQWVENSGQLVTLTLTGFGNGTHCFYNAQAVIGT